MSRARSSADGGPPAIRCRRLQPEDWPTLVELFGSNGACGGCWCMYWRRPRGGKLWEHKKGRPNRDAFRRLVKAGRVFGVLALADQTPVGWCCLGPRQDFPRLERSRALASEWDHATWSVVCFFINSRWRKRGVAGRLLDAAIEIARRQGASRLEGYPVTVQPGKSMPAAFAWTGVPALFESRNFRTMPPAGFKRDIYVLDFPRRSGRA